MSNAGDMPESFVEVENKVDIEETLVNLDCVKKEPKQEVHDFEEDNDAKQYSITLKYENIFGESSSKRKFEEDCNNLVGFLDDDVIMENTMIKLEDVKEEDGSVNSYHCSTCKGDYKWYCLKCSTLSCILNKNASFITSKSNGIPSDILEIRDTSIAKGVFLLRTLPINILFGPFEGLSGIESTVGYCWKINDNNKLVNINNGNWMKNIGCAASASFKNLDIIQVDGDLYFRSNREITEGEELLIYYDDEGLQPLNNSEECLYTPKKQKLPKIFACTLCCLGYVSNKCLMEHKRKCPWIEHTRNTKDFEVIECHYCKMWMEKWEHEEYHVAYCLEKHHRSCRNRNSPDFPPTITADEEQVHENDEITPSIDANASYSTPPTETIDSNNRFLRTEVHNEEYFHDKNMGTTHSNTNNLKSRLGTHTDVKHFQCHICKQRFGLKGNLKVHIKYQHSNTNEKEYKCSECSHQTNRKGNLKIHMETVHSNTNEKEYKCSECSHQTNRKGNLKFHMETVHSNTNEKEYKCSECCYQTNRKGDLKKHLGIHSNRDEKEYKCSECSYQTNWKGNLDTHLGTHTKHFQCNICKQRFAQKSYLQTHIKNKHSTTNEKEYKCSECSYQTNRKGNLKIHVEIVHSNTNEKEYKCSECSYQTNRKGDLKKHLGIHSNPNEKEYKCSECSYQTNCKGSLKIHVGRHTKHFQCDICKRRFAQKCHLIMHIKNKHSNTNEMEYK